MTAAQTQVTKKDARKLWHGRQHHVATLAIWSWNWLATLTLVTLWFDFASPEHVFPFLTVGTPVVYGAAITGQAAVNAMRREER